MAMHKMHESRATQGYAAGFSPMPEAALRVGRRFAEKFQLTPRGTVVCKGLGEVSTFLLTAKIAGATRIRATEAGALTIANP